jgi:undecaprenyl diphosphate synthase
MGHRHGMEAVREIILASLQLGIEHLTLFAFGVENQKRPSREVRNLFRLFLLGVRRELSFLIDNEIRLRLIGDRSIYPKALNKAVDFAVNRTADNHRLTLNLAINYSGRWDILQAVNTLHQTHAPGKPILEADMNAHLSLQACEPDILIRTGGAKRLSNFLLWDCAYSEIFFTDTLWPDFTKDEYRSILQSFLQCERRFGLTGEQLEA